MELKPIKTKKIYEEIVEQICKQVIEGKLNVGERLPSERELAERLEVSRASVREALRGLEIMGILEVRSGEGTYIRQVNIEPVVSPLTWVLSKERDTIAHLLEVRKVLEVQAVGLAAERATADDLTELTKALEAMRQDLEDNRLGDQSDHRFHYAIARATHNPILIQILDQISDTMSNSLHTLRIALFKGTTPQRLLREHTGIYEAIKRKDSGAASERMLEHLVLVEQQMLEEFDN